MRRFLLFYVILFALVIVLTGCVATELRVTNHSGGSIKFYSGHTKQEVVIPAEATVTVPHTAGKVMIARQDVVWTYDAVSLGDLSAETSKGFKRLTLPITILSNGTISLSSGRRLEPSYTNYH